MAKRVGYLWPKKRLAELEGALANVQAATEALVSLVSPIGEQPGQYRNTVFFWLPDTHCGVVWEAQYASHVNADLAKKIAKHLDYAVWRQTNPERDCIDCHAAFLPSYGWDEAGYPPDVCPSCLARRIALLGPEQVMGTPYDPRALFQRPPSPESSIDALDGPIDAL